MPYPELFSNCVELLALAEGNYELHREVSDHPQRGWSQWITRMPGFDSGPTDANRVAVPSFSVGLTVFVTE